MPSAEADKVKSSWVAEMEDEAEDTSDRKVEIRDNTKTISEITYVDGEKVKLVRHFRIEKRKVTKEAAVRKTWKKFGQSANDGPGPNSATTIPSDDVRMEFLLAKEEEQQEQEQVNSFGGNQNVQCRNCGLNHWTLQCPYKNQLNALNKLGDNSDLSKVLLLLSFLHFSLTFCFPFRMTRDCVSQACLAHSASEEWKCPVEARMKTTPSASPTCLKRHKTVTFAICSKISVELPESSWQRTRPPATRRVSHSSALRCARTRRKPSRWSTVMVTTI